MTEPARPRAGARLADGLASVLATAARAVDRILDIAGVAPPRLHLPREVRDDLHSIFGDTVDPDAIVIRRGHVPGIPHPRAFALPGLIYLGKDPGVVRRVCDVQGRTAAHDADEAARPSDAKRPAGTARPCATPTLVHELVHIWQGRVIGPRYVLLALVEQVRLGRRAYDWRAALTANPALIAGNQTQVAGIQTPLAGTAAPGPESLGFEAHAQLVSEAYARRVDQSGPTGLRAQGSRTDQERAMDAALAGLRAGDVPPETGRSV